MRTRVVWVVVGLVLAVGCGDDGGDSRSSPGTSAVPPPSRAPPPSADGCAFDGNTTPKTRAPDSGFSLLTAVRAARQPCFDRVVLEFREPGAPGFTVEYRPGPVVRDGSGDPVSVDGSAFLVIRVERASGFDSGTGTPSYTGPARLDPPDTVHVREVVRTGDFEGQLTWVVGLDGERPFTVSTLPDPTRIVVDVG